jgi:CDGSH-type Zn-finger protein
MTENKERIVSSEVTIIKHGPIKVSGNFKISGIDGKELSSDNPCEVYLCACGHSANKPFCDGSHNKTIIK